MVGVITEAAVPIPNNRFSNFGLHNKEERRRTLVLLYSYEGGEAEGLVTYFLCLHLLTALLCTFTQVSSLQCNAIESKGICTRRVYGYVIVL